MPHFVLRQDAPMTPTRCLGCSNHVGPFVDLGVEIPGYGRCYLCVKSCSWDVGRAAGMVDPEQVELMEETIVELRARADRPPERVPVEEHLARLEGAVGELNRRFVELADRMVAPEPLPLVEASTGSGRKRRTRG